jgi:ABC-2 type transport system ATP-binding protein
LEWTGLADRADEPLKRLSGGMKRRINIACGVLHRPPVVLLDEPTVGVDPQSRERIFGMLEDLRQDGCSLLLTTHQLDEAEQRCERILILDEGRLLAAGSFHDLVHQTLGSGRQVLVRLSRPPNSPIAELCALPNQNGVYQARVDDVGHELPQLLDRLRTAGCGVEGVDVRPPRLHDVYLQLTGRELRE